MKLTGKRKRELITLALCGAVFAAIFALEHLIQVAQMLVILPYLAIYAVTGWRVLYKAARGIIRGNVFDENFLMALATVGAVCIGEFGEAAAVMLFYRIGEWFEGFAVERSRKSIGELMELCPESASVERDGEVLEAEPDEVAVGEVILVKPGERAPLDGEVIDGCSLMDLSALTGESVPAEIGVGDAVFSGSVNCGSGALRIRVTKEYSDSTVSRILELTENAVSKKAKTESFITRFARYYTPAVVISAAAVAFIPPMIFGGGFAEWIHRGLTFLVISCPCALVISVPLTFFGGIGGAGRRGILIKGGSCIEALAKAKTVVFDKTGTLTKGALGVSMIVAENGDDDGLLRMAAHGELYSDHPVALAVKKAYGKAVDPAAVTDSREISGKGVVCKIHGQSVAIGNAGLMKEMGVAARSVGGTVLHVALEGEYAGHILLTDEVKAESAEAVAMLKKIGVRRTVMLSGDRAEVADFVASTVGLDEARAELLPDGKVAAMEEIIGGAAKGETVVYVGDGINDAPVLAVADIGIAMGAMGSDVAIEAADIVLMDDDPRKVGLAMEISAGVMGIAWQNIVFALGVKLAVLVLGALGIADMWAAVFADVGVSVIAILNAMRALKR